MNRNPESRARYGKQALALAGALVVGAAAVYWVLGHDGSGLWLLAAETLLILACATNDTVGNYLSAGAGAPDTGVSTVAGIVVTIVVVLAAPLVALILLIWALMRIALAD